MLLLVVQLFEFTNILSDQMNCFKNTNFESLGMMCVLDPQNSALVSRFAFTENVVGMAQKPLFSQSCSTEGNRWLLSQQCSL